ncbi:MAG TPA: DNA-3-methyladenine glycosylase [Bacteroidia bacterium]|nr:DNA-3-methyladenine glycosylase [Bacteroidia bacterium]HNU34893.1 DNA-3-methyladenine glycosylase [Bacteroidia bacterium]
MPHRHLSKDKKLKPIIAKHGELKLKKRKDIFMALCSSIMSQQLSVKVADVIESRFLKLFNNSKPTPELLLQMEHETLRSIGLSNAKAVYIKNVAQFAIDSGLDFKKLNAMQENDLVEYLTRIKGVGKWTAEMIMMFALGKEDVFSTGDLGIQIAIKNIYGIKAKDKKQFEKKMLALAENWKPYRTYACMYLWRHKDGK